MLQMKHPYYISPSHIGLRKIKMNRKLHVAASQTDCHIARANYEWREMFLHTVEQDMDIILGNVNVRESFEQHTDINPVLTHVPYNSLYYSSKYLNCRLFDIHLFYVSLATFYTTFIVPIIVFKSTIIKYFNPFYYAKGTQWQTLQTPVHPIQ